MGKVTIEFDTENAAFDAFESELRWILNQAARSVLVQHLVRPGATGEATEDNLTASNGNTVGSVKWNP